MVRGVALESDGKWRLEFTVEGCIGMAWMMGYIKHFDGRLRMDLSISGELTARRGSLSTTRMYVVAMRKIEKEILNYAGVRLIGESHSHRYNCDPTHTEPELFRGGNQAVELIHDLEPIEPQAARLKYQLGDHCDIWAVDSGQWLVTFKGACILVPKAFTFSRSVSGLIPTEWHAGRYGIPEEIIA